ncbi:WD repeat-containing protein 97-like [Sphaeramia orbicularis]|uniref:WD repeat-containing protein 97-like n=1 Tax=Sphaeramia orbicularis TaxID=375764 RepID=UPI00117F10D7|nr:WD repeat-containing protein 97 [Sphaeramia orbicularis]
MEAYPERGCLLSAGEDKTVVVWLVNPCISECLTKQMSLYCGQPHVYLAVLGPRLALTFEEPASGTYSLMHFNFTDQTQTDHPPREEHLDHFTGLCVCPDLEVFVSSSLDGTVHIWNEENRLISTLQLNAVPECIAYSGFGEVLLGIRGSLYKMNCAKFLPRYYQKMLFYTYHGDLLPDLPITKTDESPKTQTVERVQNEEHESLVNLSRDLAALLQGTVKCTKPKPPSTKETRKEAFNRYMKMIYGLPYNIKGDLEDSFDPDMYSFDPVPYTKPCDVPAIAEDVSPKINIPVQVEKKKIKVTI